MIIQRGNRQIIISDNHSQYYDEIQIDFDHYFNAVKFNNVDGMQIVDFSKVYWHDVNGFDLHQILFPAIAEPISTTQQYIDLLQIKEGDTILDLGAYSGLSGILFKQIVGKSGIVISVEADIFNYTACVQNISKYYEITGNNINLFHYAIWNNCNGLQFYSEGAMGSSNHTRRGLCLNVNSITMTKLAELNNLSKIDAIKCDIEGAERVVFDDVDFFNKYKPKLVIEMHFHLVDNDFQQLKNIGYMFETHKQVGSPYPLLVGKCKK